MSGLVKPKEYNWKDSNLALFGSDTEKQVKKESAQSEPAWRNAGKNVGLQIWRIVNFKVVAWPSSQYGQFFNGDSYIVLNTYKPNPSSNELAYDVHFWIGANSSQDEYGTAAYKTVELDTFLDDKPVQHRECEGHESNLFKTYFPSGLTILEGGADSGFNHVEPEKYTPRFFHFSGTGKNIVVNQIPPCRSLLDSNDVFILDLGLTIYQWNGSSSSVFEKNKAVTYLNGLKSERSGKAIAVEVLDEGSSGLDDSHPFFEALNAEDAGEKPDSLSRSASVTPQLFKVSDAGGSIECSPVKSGSVSRSDFASEDVFLFDTQNTCFVWVGSGASPNEKKNGLAYAHNHLMETVDPLRSIAVIKEGQESKEFLIAIAA
jgi:gelsolin